MESLPYISVTLSHSFYRRLIKRLGSYPHKQYINQMQIPNDLKKNTFDRSLTINFLDQNKSKRILHLGTGIRVNNRNTTHVFLHITSSDMKLKWTDNLVQKILNLEQFRTYVFSFSCVEQADIAVLTMDKTAIIGLEWICRDQNYDPRYNFTSESILPVDRTFWETYSSFTLSPLFNEVQQIIFLSTRFVYGITGQACLAAICIRDYYGIIIMDHLVTPREFILNYNTRFTGIGEAQLCGKLDHWTLHPSIERILYGKIIVGYKLSRQLQRMGIRPEGIRGLRDLALSPCFSDNNHVEEPWDLRQLATMNNLTFRSTMTVKDDALLIYDLYKKVEGFWKDSYAPWKGDMFKIPWNIVTPNAIHYYPIVWRQKVNPSTKPNSTNMTNNDILILLERERLNSIRPTTNRPIISQPTTSQPITNQPTHDVTEEIEKWTTDQPEKKEIDEKSDEDSDEDVYLDLEQIDSDAMDF